ncbi:glycosyl transferase [Christiangramia salexigens]|uniref:Glycosyl transferase n=2 Tax=Christiangramia salexigens TaxID=1913577 RepID=A0A1L3J8D9_9FLAO|nr:glycosyl transferase [Christiangramia salexigens]
MHFSVFTHAEHFEKESFLCAYSPFVREMDIWFEYAGEVLIVSPVKDKIDRIDKAYDRNDICFQPIKSLNFTTFKNLIISAIRIPRILFGIFRAMYKTDHIHIRCPGNIGLLACLMQVFFPKKTKSIKYAGNWDPNSNQPLSYRFQKWILKNEVLTRKAKVLVYGNWNDLSKNVVPFFTSSYSVTQKKVYNKEFSAPYRFVFIGTLSEGKRPLLAVKIIQELLDKGYDVSLDIYGSGSMHEYLSTYIENNQLGGNVILHGNQGSEVIMHAYKNSHFSLLASKSEGWPKALAEAMFFGCIPIASPVSCVPWMLGNGDRGILIKPEIQSAVQGISNVLSNSEKLHSVSLKAQKWSQNYTLEKFRSEIIKLL